MKDIVKKIDKESIITLGIVKTIIYILWYMMALLFLFFINGEVNKTSLITLLLMLGIVFVLRTYAKNIYRSKKSITYYNLKHTVELYLFEKINGIKNDKVLDLDKNRLANKILQFTYNLTKIYNDIENCVIPLFLGSIIMFIVVARKSVLFALLLTIIIAIVCIFRYKYIVTDEDKNWLNYNDLLKDFILKLNTIKKLNLFDYCYKKLKENSENDIVIVRDEYKEDVFFNNCVYGFLFIMAGFMIIVESSISSIVGHMIFFGVMMIKIKDLIYKLCPCIKNIFTTYSNYHELEEFFSDNITPKYVSGFKKIELDNMIYNCRDSACSITVNNLEIEKGDEISIMGKPGQGKSTILNVLSGMYKLDIGSISVDDNPVDGYIDLAHLSYNDDLFNLTLRENLSLGMKVSDEQILQYIDEAGLSEWFGLLGDGLNTQLDERYIDISNDEKIKLNIIRGIILDKPLYLIDDFGDFLDIDDEKALAEMIKKYLRKKTFIIVAHKPIFTTICKKHYFIKNHTLLEKETLL